MDPALPRTGLTLLSSSGIDPVTAFRDNIRAIGTILEVNAALFTQGPLSSRPAVGKAGRCFKTVDPGVPEDGLFYYDNGTSWVAIGAGAPADPAPATPGLRSLGSGANQAAAGNHSHSVTSLVGAGTAAALSVGTTTGTVADGGAANDILIHTIMGSI